MLGWLFGKKRSADVPIRKLAPGDSKHIGAALAELEKVGIKFKPGVKEQLREVSEHIASTLQGKSFAREPTSGLWALIALQRGDDIFENAVCLGDHCYDGIDADDFSRLITDILHLSGNEWPFDSVTVKDLQRPDGPLQYEQPVNVAIHCKRGVTPFSLVNAKDFDWSLIFRLNERLPQDASGRFWAFLDGNATIVYLPQEKIRQLEALCGYKFFSEPD